MQTTDEYKTAIVCPTEALADAVVAALVALHYRSTVVKRKAWWVHTDAPQRKVNTLMIPLSQRRELW